MNTSQTESDRAEEDEVSAGTVSLVNEPSATGGTTGVVLLGEALRKAREARSETLGDISLSLKLTKRQLESLESGDYKGLPGPAFIRGFIRNYARHLGLDAEALLAQYGVLQENVEFVPIPSAKGEMPLGAKKGFKKKSLVWISVLLLLILIGGYFDWFETENDGARTEPVPVAPVSRAQNMTVQNQAAHVLPPQVQVLDTPEQTVGEQTLVQSEAEEETPLEREAQVIPEAHEALPVSEPVLSFNLTKTSWIEVYEASGAALYKGQTAAGKQLEFKGGAPFRVVIGEPSGVALEYDGKPVDLSRPIARGAVARLTVQ